MTTTLNNPGKQARTAGLAYLIIAAVGAFAIAYVPSQIVVAGDAPETFARLQAHIGLFRAGIFADLAVIILEIELTTILYFLLRPVDPLGSMIAAMARFAMVFVMLVNLLVNATAFMMAKGTITGSPETVLVLFEVHAQGIYLWGIVFAHHLLMLGILIWRSGYLPKWFGGALVIGSFGYLIDGLLALMLADIPALTLASNALLVIATIGELGFALWLLIKGLDENKLKSFLSRETPQ